MDNIIENLINIFKGKYKLELGNNEICFHTDYNTNPLEKDDFVISFQKENESFTVISKRTNQINMDENILELLNSNFNLTPKYIYCFKENPEYLIYHFCLGKNKENDKLMEDLKKENAFLRFQKLY